MVLLVNCSSGVKVLAKRPSADLEDGEISKEEEEKVTTTTDHPSNPAFPTSNHQLESSILLSPTVHQIPVTMGSRSVHPKFISEQCDHRVICLTFKLACPWYITLQFMIHTKLSHYRFLALP